MKILRVLRNVAALFIFAMALLSVWPGVQLLHADAYTYCGYKKGAQQCVFDSTTGACIGDVKCASDVGCPNVGCTNAQQCHPKGCGF